MKETRFIVSGKKIPKSVPLRNYSVAIDYAIYHENKNKGKAIIRKVRI